MPVKFPKGIDLGGQRLVNLGDGSGPTDAVTLQQLQAFIRGLSWKQAARVRATGNVTLTAPGATINGVTMATGDRLLAPSQTTGSQNGIYVWNGAAVAATRATDADSTAELVGAAVYVTEGTTLGDTAWIMTTDPFTLDTTTGVWTQFGGGGAAYSNGNGLSLISNVFAVQLDSASGLLVSGTGLKIDPSVVTRKFAADCVATTNPQTFTHGLGTNDVEVTVWSSGGAMVIPDISKAAGTVTIDWGTAPAAGDYRVIIQG